MFKITCFAILLLVSSFTHAKVIVQKLTLGEIINTTLQSEILHNSREFSVYLPDSYSETKKEYSTLYLLDGERHLPHAVTVSKLYAELGIAPELIIVAIPNTGKDGDRERDLYHERATFQQFIKNDVMAYVNQKYRTSGDNIIYGHSLSAFFALDFFSQSPSHFKRIIAASPPLSKNGTQIYNSMLSSKFKEDKHLYFTMASAAEEGASVTNAYQNFVKLLEQKSPEGLQWSHEIMEDQTHITNYYITMFKGLAKVFK